MEEDLKYIVTSLVSNPEKEAIKSNQELKHNVGNLMTGLFGSLISLGLENSVVDELANMVEDRKEDLKDVDEETINTAMEMAIPAMKELFEKFRKPQIVKGFVETSEDYLEFIETLHQVTSFCAHMTLMGMEEEEIEEILVRSLTKSKYPLTREGVEKCSKEINRVTQSLSHENLVMAKNGDRSIYDSVCLRIAQYFFF